MRDEGKDRRSCALVSCDLKILSRNTCVMYQEDWV